MLLLVLLQNRRSSARAEREVLAYVLAGNIDRFERLDVFFVTNGTKKPS